MFAIFLHVDLLYIGRKHPHVDSYHSQFLFSYPYIFGLTLSRFSLHSDRNPMDIINIGVVQAVSALPLMYVWHYFSSETLIRY